MVFQKPVQKITGNMKRKFYGRMFFYCPNKRKICVLITLLNYMLKVANRLVVVDAENKVWQ